MATVNSTQYAKQAGTAGSSRAVTYPTPMDVGGKLRIAIANITTGTAVTANDIWNLAKLPIGAKPIPALSWVANEAASSDASADALVIDIGYSSNADALSDALDIAAAGEKRFSEGGTVAVGELTPPSIATEADTVIYATVKTATAVAGAKDYTFYIAYLSE